MPIGYTVYLSLRRVHVSGLGLGAAARRETFVGLANYRAALADTEFWHSALRVLIYGCLLVPTMLGLALLFALLLDVPRARARRFSRIAIFLPYAVPAVIASLMSGFTRWRPTCARAGGGRSAPSPARSTPPAASSGCSASATRSATCPRT